MFQLRVLLSQRLALGLRLLTIAYPLRSTSFEQALGVFQLRSFLFQLQRRLFLQRRRPLDPSVAFLQPRDLFPQRCIGFKQSFAATFLAIEGVERLQLDVQREQRLDRIAQGVEL